MQRLFLLLLFLSFNTALWGQEQDSSVTNIDTVLLQKDFIITIADSAMYAKEDTVLFLPDTVEYIIKPTPTDKTKAFYESLKNKFYQTRLTKELYDLLFTDAPQQEPASLPDHDETEKSVDPYLAFEGKIIGNIRIKKINVFGTDIEDTTKQVNSWIVNTGNKFHINSRAWVIRKSLLIKKGDVLDPFELADNERIIRELAFIQDARIKVAPRTTGSDTVDIILITKDVWSISANVNPHGFMEGRVNISDKNILGLGHELDNAIILSPDETQLWGYEGIYRMPNIFGAFITNEVNYANTYSKNGYGLKLYRRFITPEMKYAGGLELGKQQLRQQIIQADTVSLQFPFTYSLQDIWLGRSFLLKKKEDKRAQVILSSRYTRKHFSERPLVAVDTNRLYHNASLVLASIGYSTKEYYKSLYIYGFGRTEDIPEGALAELTGGIEVGEFYTRYYTGVRLARGVMFPSKGYFYGEANLGGFLKNGHYEQGVVNISTNMFSNLYHLKNHSIRHFLNVKYTRGVRRFSEEFITINNESGVRGLNSTFLRGTKKFALNFETIVFTPFQPVGFQFAFFGFADMGVISDKKNVFQGEAYTGFGLGLRIRNDNLTFNTFQIRLGYYPKTPLDESMFDLDVSGISSFRQDNFEVNAPAIVEFR